MFHIHFIIYIITTCPYRYSLLVYATKSVKLTFTLLSLGQVFVFVALLCYAVASRPPYIAATCMEFFVTLGFLLLYLLKLNKRFTFIFWALIVRRKNICHLIHLCSIFMINININITIKFIRFYYCPESFALVTLQY